MSKVIQLTGQVGRLDKVLGDLFTEESRSTLQKWIKADQVYVDGDIQKANYKLKGTETIRIADLPLVEKEEDLELVGEPMDLDIIFEDSDVLVINKPAGLVVHPSKGHASGTLVNGLIHYLGDQLATEGQAFRPGLVHRIDKDTSGLIVIAKTNQSHQKLSQQLEDHTMARTYVALVNGLVKENQGTIEVPLKRDPANRLRWTADKSGKYAVTHFNVLERFASTSFVELHLETGRTHQIRVHMEFIGHPIVGDPVYRKGLNQAKSSLSHLSDGQLLHAKAIEFIHPTSGQVMNFEAPLPQHFYLILQGEEEQK